MRAARTQTISFFRVTVSGEEFSGRYKEVPLKKALPAWKQCSDIVSSQGFELPGQVAYVYSIRSDGRHFGHYLSQNFNLKVWNKCCEFKVFNDALSQCDSDGRTPMHHLATQYKDDALEAWLNHDHSSKWLYQEDRFGYTPIWIALRKSNVGFIEKLFDHKDHGLKVKSIFKENANAIIDCFIKKKNKNVIQFILNQSKNMGLSQLQRDNLRNGLDQCESKGVKRSRDCSGGEGAKKAKVIKC
ncbi:MAG: hypothetical protein ACON5A_02515 [Candidatus Comchoanobacterales bacterium]